LRGKLNQFLDLAAGLNTKKVVYFTAINKMCQCRGCDEDTAYLQGLGEGWQDNAFSSAATIRLFSWRAFLLLEWRLFLLCNERQKFLLHGRRWYEEEAGPSDQPAPNHPNQTNPNKTAAHDVV
jgi:hypothetical protein